MEVSELREALVDSTLEEVAEAQGVDYADVVAAALASAKADLDAAVEAGTITQDKADAIYARLETWLNEGGIGNWGERDGRPGPGRPFFGPPTSTDGATDGSTDGSAEGTSA
jgi:ribosomal protein S20